MSYILNVYIHIFVNLCSYLLQMDESQNSFYLYEENQNKRLVTLYGLIGFNSFYLCYCELNNFENMAT